MGSTMTDEELETTLNDVADEAEQVDNEPVMPVAGDLQDIAAGLKAQRRKAQQSREPLYLEVPGTQGQIVARYGIVDWSILKKITEQVMKSKDESRELKGHAAVIGVACVELFAVVGKGSDVSGAFQPDGFGKTLVPMSRVVGTDLPVKYDSQAFADFYGYDFDSVTEAVLNVIAPVTEKGERENAFLVTVHHNEIMLWISEESEAADEDFLGESKAAGR